MKPKIQIKGKGSLERWPNGQFRSNADKQAVMKLFHKIIHDQILSGGLTVESVSVAKAGTIRTVSVSR